MVQAPRVTLIVDHAGDLVPPAAAQVRKLTDAGITGQLTCITWDEEYDELSALLIIDGQMLKIGASDNMFFVHRIAEANLDRNHQGKSLYVAPDDHEGPTLEGIAYAVNSCLAVTRLADAWVSGKVRGTVDVDFGIPEVREIEEDSLQVKVDIQCRDAILAATLTADDTLVVSGWADRAMTETGAADYMESVLSGLGCTPADLAESLKACRTAF